LLRFGSLALLGLLACVGLVGATPPKSAPQKALSESAGPRDGERDRVPARAAPTVKAPKLEQLLVVRSRNWSAATGTLQRYERASEQPWQAVGAAIAVNLGRRGMAWGRGLHEPVSAGADAPLKKEGDGKTPAGSFALERAFGSAPSLPDKSRGFPYLQADAQTYCVEDTRSTLYNRIIDAREVEQKTWERWSPLLRPDGLFRWGVVVRQNEMPPVIGAGSCVFLHVWRGPGQGTSGCTAMAAGDIEETLVWLDEAASPRLVQLPEALYQAKRDVWDLPQ